MAGGALLQSAASSTGNGNVFNARGLAGTYKLSIETTGTASAGAVTFEHALTAAGPWEAMAPPVAPVTDALTSTLLSGRFHHIRGRISTAVTGGGTVNVRVEPPQLGEFD